MTTVDTVTYWWKRAKRAEATLERLRKAAESDAQLARYLEGTQ